MCPSVAKCFGDDWYSAVKQTTNKNTVYIGQLFIFKKQTSNFNLRFILLTKICMCCFVVKYFGDDW
jgi:hypothetical protein